MALRSSHFLLSGLDFCVFFFFFCFFFFFFFHYYLFFSFFHLEVWSSTSYEGRSFSNATRSVSKKSSEEFRNGLWQVREQCLT